MIKVLINKHVLKLYDSIEDMPILNFQKYNKFLLIDSGIGSTLDDYNEHINRIIRYINESNQKNLMIELSNTRQLLYMINQEISPKYMAFAALIAEIDGKPVTDLSDDNLRSILQQLRDVKHGWLISKLAGLKKKVETELELYFPKMFNSAKDKEAFSKLKERTLLELEGLISGDNMAEKINKIESFLFNMFKPKTFIGPESVEISHDKSFENTCIAIKSKLNLEAKSLSVLSFYNALEALNKMAEEYKSKKK